MNPREIPRDHAACKPPWWMPSWFPWLVLAVLWFSLVGQLWLEWSTNEDYSYGFVVPALALYIFSRRWAGRPTPQETGLSGGAVFALLAAPAFLLLPIRLIQEANPEWRFVSWCMAAVVVALTLGLVYCRGGWIWVRHFAFPVAFIFTAVPWPTVLEGPLTQSLMQTDTHLVVSALNWLGMPVAQNGNVIEFAGALTNVGEACSGIRSLQITLMVSLFFGELYSYPPRRRFALVLVFATVALVFNFWRTLLLTLTSILWGNACMEKWHSTVGLAVLAASLATFWAAASWMNPKRPDPPNFRGPGKRPPSALRPWPPVLVGALAIWLVLVQTSTEIWYRSHQPGLPAAGSAWSVRWPESSPNYKERPVGERSKSILKYSAGRHASWSDANGLSWSVFFFQWAPGRTSAMLARCHRPEICLPAIGCKLIRSGRARIMDVNGYSIPFYSYVFEQAGKPVYVWWCIWDAASPPNQPVPNPTSDGSLPDKEILQSVLNGRRNSGQQVLEIALSGAGSAGQADEVLAGLLPDLISVHLPE